MPGSVQRTMQPHPSRPTGTTVLGLPDVDRGRASVPRLRSGRCPRSSSQASLRSQLTVIFLVEVDRRAADRGDVRQRLRSAAVSSSPSPARPTSTSGRHSTTDGLLESNHYFRLRHRVDHFNGYLKSHEAIERSRTRRICGVAAQSLSTSSRSPKLPADPPAATRSATPRLDPKGYLPTITPGN